MRAQLLLGPLFLWAWRASGTEEGLSREDFNGGGGGGGYPSGGYPGGGFPGFPGGHQKSSCRPSTITNTATINQTVTADHYVTIVSNITETIVQTIDHTVTQTIQQTVDQTITQTVQQTINQTVISEVPVTINQTITNDVPVTVHDTTTINQTQIVDLTTTVDRTIVTTAVSISVTTFVSTITLPPETVTSVVTLTQPGSVITSVVTTTLPASTVTITLPGSVVTSVVTTTLPASTTTTTVTRTITLNGPTATVCGRGCQVDVTGTILSLTGRVSTVTAVYTTKLVQVFVSTGSGGQPISTAVTAAIAPPAPSHLTFEYSGVTLTYPTTYVAYFGFQHLSVAVVNGDCSTSGEELFLPTPTDYASLVFPSSLISTQNLPPSALIDYLNAQPTVIQQLGGPIGASCDPLVGGFEGPVTATGQLALYLTTASALLAETQTTYVTAPEAVVTIGVGGSTTVLSFPTGSPEPPPPPPPPPPQSVTSAPPSASGNATYVPTPTMYTGQAGHGPTPAFGGIERWIAGAAGLVIGWL